MVLYQHIADVDFTLTIPILQMKREQPICLFSLKGQWEFGHWFQLNHDKIGGTLSTDCLRNWTGKKWWPRERIFTFHLNIKLCTYIERDIEMSHCLRSQNSAGWESQDCFQKEVRPRIKEIWHDWFFERLSENIWLELYSIWIRKCTERALRSYILKQNISLPWVGNYGSWLLTIREVFNLGLNRLSQLHELLRLMKNHILKQSKGIL